MTTAWQFFYIGVGVVGSLFMRWLFSTTDAPTPSFEPSKRDVARYAATVERLDRLEQRADISAALERDRERWN
jgi:hypothetical protein